MKNEYIIAQHEWMTLRFALIKLKNVVPDIEAHSDKIDSYYSAMNALDDFLDRHVGVF